MFLRQFGLSALLRTFWRPIGVTWSLVLVENFFMALIPLLIGLAIDGLLEGRLQELYWLAITMIMVTGVAVIRRIYDTRTYGTMRVNLGALLNRRHRHLPVSARSARLDMARELVDFLEGQVPELMTAIVQLLVALALLALFDVRLALSALLLMAAMIILYSFFHTSIVRFNAALNAQVEKQVGILQRGKLLGVFAHLRSLRHWEVKLSDLEAILFGLIFLCVTAFIVANLWMSAGLADMTTGKLFSIITYSWSFVEAIIMLPVVLQSWSRLSEITGRINDVSLSALGQKGEGENDFG